MTDTTHVHRSLARSAETRHLEHSSRRQITCSSSSPVTRRKLGVVLLSSIQSIADQVGSLLYLKS